MKRRHATLTASVKVRLVSRLIPNYIAPKNLFSLLNDIERER